MDSSTIPMIWRSPATSTVVVVEYKNNRIQRFDPTGKWIASWGGPGFEPGG